MHVRGHVPKAKRYDIQYTWRTGTQQRGAVCAARGLFDVRGRRRNLRRSGPPHREGPGDTHRCGPLGRRQSGPAEQQHAQLGHLLLRRHLSRHDRRAHPARLLGRRARHDHRPLRSQGPAGLRQTLHQAIQKHHRTAQRRGPHQESGHHLPACPRPGNRRRAQARRPGRHHLHLGHHVEAQGRHAHPRGALRPGAALVVDLPHRRQRRLPLGASPVAHLRVLDRLDLPLLHGFARSLHGSPAHGFGADAGPAFGAPHGDAHRAADHREDLPPPGAGQVQLHPFLAPALPHRLHAPLPPPRRRQEADETLRQTPALPRHRRFQARFAGREVPARIGRSLCHRLRTHGNRPAAGRRRTLAGASGFDRPPGSGRDAAARKHQPRDAAGRNRGQDPEHHAGLL